MKDAIVIPVHESLFGEDCDWKSLCKEIERTAREDMGGYEGALKVRILENATVTTKDGRTFNFDEEGFVAVRVRAVTSDVG